MLSVYSALLEQYTPYAVSLPALARRLNPTPLGISIRPEHEFDPTRISSTAFLSLIERLDSVTFGPLALSMPRWALYDCAELPGIIFGFGQSADGLPARLRSALDVPASYRGLVPISMFFAVPMLEPGHFLGYSISDLYEVAPDLAPPGLRLLTLAAALDALGADELTGTTQWASPKLRIYARFGPLNLLAAWTPAHSEPATCVFRFATSRQDIAAALAVTPVPRPQNGISYVNVSRRQELCDLQAAIESGEQRAIAGPPEEHGALLCAPVRSGRAKPSIPDLRTPEAGTRTPVAPLNPENPSLLERLRPFVVATEENLARFDLSPFGLTIFREHRVDPLKVGSARFLELLSELDAVAFGPSGMPMPRWIFFNGGELSGGIVGFGIPADSTSNDTRALLGATSADSLVPLSMFIAIPAVEANTWVGHNLSSLSRQVPEEDLRGLGSLTKAVALRVFRTKHQIGAAQWTSPALRVHTRLGPLEVLSAWTPAHAKPWTVTYRATTTEAALRNLARDPAGRIDALAADLWLDSDDHEAMKAIQMRIEGGERFVIADRPTLHEGWRLRFPIARIG